MLQEKKMTREMELLIFSLFLTAEEGRTPNHYMTANMDQTHRNFPLLPNPASMEAMEDFATGAAGERNVNEVIK